ncbi:hypothetical protein IIB34_06480 [PVC group bacterium]|nr:hypothetical protein [PVC group bacterium]
MTLNGTIATEVGAIKIGTRRVPEEISGEAHYVHTSGDFVINAKEETEKTTVLKTERGDVLRYNPNRELILEAPNGIIKDLTNSALSVHDLILIGNGFFVSTITDKLTIQKDTEIFITDAFMNGDYAFIEGPDLSVSYPGAAELTLRTTGPIRTGKDAVLAASRLNLRGNTFGSYYVPINTNTLNLKVQRLAGDIEILESLGIGTTVQIRGPPDGWGSIVYKEDTHLTLEADRVTMPGPDPIYLYGDMTLYNLNVTTPDKEIYFQPGKTYTLKGDNINIIGAPDQGSEEFYIKMRSFVPGQEWFLNMEADSYFFDRINISDSNAIEYIEIPLGIDAGNNTNM